MASKDPQDPNDGEGKRSPVATDSAMMAKARIGAVRELDPRSQEAIGRSLRAHYDDLVRAPVPDKFLELLDRLEAREQSGKSQGEDDESGRL